MKFKKSFLILSLITMFICAIGLSFGVFAASNFSLSITGGATFDVDECFVSIDATITGIKGGPKKYSFTSSQNGVTPNWTFDGLTFENTTAGSELKITLVTKNYSSFPVKVIMSGYNITSSSYSIQNYGEQSILGEYVSGYDPIENETGFYYTISSSLSGMLNLANIPLAIQVSRQAYTPDSMFTATSGVISIVNSSVTETVVPRSIGGVNITGYNITGTSTNAVLISLPIGCNTLNDSMSNSTITNITFSNHVTSIVNFFSKSALKSFIAPKYYNNYVSLMGATNILRVKLSENITTVGGLSSLTNMRELSPMPKLITINISAFSDCANLKSFTLADTVQTISASAFSGCSKLRLSSNVLPSSLTIIGDSAFRLCSNLVDSGITIPNSVTSIGNAAFSGTALTSMTVPFVGYTKESFKYLDFWFSGKTTASSTSVSVPSSLTTITITNDTSIGDYAFYYCAYLRTVNLKSGTLSIGAYAFQYCIKLTGLYNYSTVTSMGTYALANCTSLTSFTFPTRIVGLPSYLLSGCNNLTTLNFNSYTTVIGDYAFQNCNLTNLTIPSSILTLGLGCLNGNNLTTLTLPFVGQTYSSNKYFSYIFGASSNTVSGFVPITLKTVTVTNEYTSTTLGVNTFYGCSGITTLNFDTSVAFTNNALTGLTGLTSLKLNKTSGTQFSDLFGGNIMYNNPAGTSQIWDDFGIPTTLTTVIINEGIIPESYFYYNKYLQKAVIGPNITSIGDKAFMGCIALKTVYIASSSIINTLTQANSVAASGYLISNASSVYTNTSAVGNYLGSYFTRYNSTSSLGGITFTGYYLPNSGKCVNGAIQMSASSTSYIHNISTANAVWTKPSSSNSTLRSPAAYFKFYNSTSNYVQYTFKSNTSGQDNYAYLLDRNCLNYNLDRYWNNDDANGSTDRGFILENIVIAPNDFVYIVACISYSATTTTGTMNISVTNISSSTSFGKSSLSLRKVGEGITKFALDSTYTKFTTITSSRGYTIYFQFVAPETKKYTFFTYNTSYTGSRDVYGYLLGSSTATTSLANGDDEGNNNQFKFTYDCTAGTSYYLYISFYGTSGTSGVFDVVIM